MHIARFTVLALLSVGAVGCRSEAPAPAPSDSSAVAAEAASPPTSAARDSSTATGPAAPGDAVTVLSAVAGDRGCYLSVAPEGEPPAERMAAFEICERTDLIGMRVRLVSEMQNVQAMSCQGDPECTATERVDVVTAVVDAD